MTYDTGRKIPNHLKPLKRPLVVDVLQVSRVYHKNLITPPLSCPPVVDALPRRIHYTFIVEPFVLLILMRFC